MLSSQTSRVYCDDYDLQGVLAVLERRIADADRSHDQAMADIGAHTAISLLKNHRLATQADFFAAYDELIKECF